MSHFTESYELVQGSVRTLPNGRRFGVVSVSEVQAVLAFLGEDPAWSGGTVVAPDKHNCRDGFTFRMTGTHRDKFSRCVVHLTVCSRQYSPGPQDATAH